MFSQVSVLPRQGLNPRQVETAERLLAAGREELEAVGHEALTVRTVAARAGVSSATAYTYLASKNHLFVELFWRMLADEETELPEQATSVERLQAVTRGLADRLSRSPKLAAAVTPALLGSDPDVERLRLLIGAAFVERFKVALGADARPDVLETVTLAFSGALLQAGMGLMTYTEMGERLDSVVAVIMSGNS